MFFAIANQNCCNVMAAPVGRQPWGPHRPRSVQNVTVAPKGGRAGLAVLVTRDRWDPHPGPSDPGCRGSLGHIVGGWTSARQRRNRLILPDWGPPAGARAVPAHSPNSKKSWEIILRPCILSHLRPKLASGGLEGSPRPRALYAG